MRLIIYNVFMAERKVDGLYNYFAAEDVHSEGRITRWRQKALNNNLSKDRLDGVVEEAMTGAIYELKAIIISLARLSLLAPAMRAAILIGRKVKEITGGGTSRGAE